jgi:hypothetical protein
MFNFEKCFYEGELNHEHHNDMCYLIKDLVYVNIPKVASSAVRACFPNFIADKFHKFENDPTKTKVALVREPISRIISAYMQLAKKDWYDADWPTEDPSYIRFKDFINKINESGYFNVHCQTQCNFLWSFKENRWMKLDYVIPMENLNKIFGNLPRINVSNTYTRNHIEIQVREDKDLMALIRKLYECDFVLYEQACEQLHNV